MFRPDQLERLDHTSGGGAVDSSGADGGGAPPRSAAAWPRAAGGGVTAMPWPLPAVFRRGGGGGSGDAAAAQTPSARTGGGGGPPLSPGAFSPDSVGGLALYAGGPADAHATIVGAGDGGGGGGGGGGLAGGLFSRARSARALGLGGLSFAFGSAAAADDTHDSAALASAAEEGFTQWRPPPLAGAGGSLALSVGAPAGLRRAGAGGCGGSKKKGGGAGSQVRNWLRIDEHGEGSMVQADKHRLTHRLGLRGRDLRIMEPSLATTYPSAILCRDKALVVNLEHIKVGACASGGPRALQFASPHALPPSLLPR
jgi:magnesium transporter